MNILQEIPARPFTMGPLQVFRALPSVKRRMVGPFTFMDTGGPQYIHKEHFRGVPEHPHVGLSTFTYLLDGAVQHIDSTGYRALVQSGRVCGVDTTYETEVKDFFDIDRQAY